MNLLELFTSNAWALHRCVFDSLQSVLLRHAAGEKLARAEVDAIVAAAREDRPSAELEFQVLGGVAVVPIRGVIARHASMVNGTSQERGTAVDTIRAQLNEALGDPDVRSILLDVSSPGGMVSGLTDLAAEVRAADRRKPVYAFADGIAASAAYWLASQARKFSSTVDALVGSIGVYAPVVDTSAAAERMGAKVHVLRSGPHKGAGDIDGAPVSEEQLEAMQQIVDDHAANFKAAVKRGRGGRIASLDAVTTGEAWVGNRAKALGLVDEISTFDRVLRSIQAEHRQADQGQGNAAAATQPQEFESMNLETLKSQHPELSKQVHAQGVAEGREAQQSEQAAAVATAVQAERTRCASIFRRSTASQRELALDHVEKGTETAVAYEALIDDPRRDAATELANQQASAAPAVPPAAPATGDGAVSPQSFVRALAARWNKNEKIRAEYGVFEAFVGQEGFDASTRGERVDMTIPEDLELVR